MSRNRWLLLFFPFMLLLCVMLQLTHPHDLFMSQLTGAMIPFTAAGFGVARSAVRRSEQQDRELELLRKKFSEVKNKPVLVLPSEAQFTQMTGPEKEYVPEGQADLSRDLLDLLKEEVAASGGELVEYQVHFPSFHWFMSPEWLAEVRKVRTNGASGRLVYVPRERTSKSKFEGKLYGYPVVVSDAFGVPELREP